MNNSTGPLNSSKNWWSVIKAFKDLDKYDKYRYSVIEEIINSIDNEQVQDLLTRVLEIWDGRNLEIHATNGLVSGGTQYAGQVPENKLTPAQETRRKALEVKVNNNTISREENEEYEKLVSLAGFILQDNESGPPLFFSLAIKTADGTRRVNPTTIFTEKRKISFGHTTLPQFISDLEEVLRIAENS